MSKKLIIILLVVAFSGTLSQSIAQMKYGGGVFYGTYLDNFGVDLRAEYHLTDDLLISPKLDLSFPDIAFGPTFHNEACLHFHYLVYKEDKILLYPLVGLNIQNYVDFDSNPFDIDLGFGVGVCGGVGGQLQISDGMSMFGEARYSTGRYHQFVIAGGIIIHRGEKNVD